jgi:hypothetical protein
MSTRGFSAASAAGTALSDEAHPALKLKHIASTIAINTSLQFIDSLFIALPSQRIIRT